MNLEWTRKRRWDSFDDGEHFIHEVVGRHIFIDECVGRYIVWECAGQSGPAASVAEAKEIITAKLIAQRMVS